VKNCLHKQSLELFVLCHGGESGSRRMPCIVKMLLEGAGTVQGTRICTQRIVLRLAKLGEQ